MKKRWLLVLLFIGLGFGGYWFFAIPATTLPGGSESKTRFTPGPFEVISETFEAVDESRPTPSYKDFPGRPTRVLKGGLWRPAGPPQAGPLVVYSHGFMSFREEGLYLVRAFWPAMATVVAVDYPLPGFHSPDGPVMRDVVSQPGDVSFLIDTLLKRNADPVDVLFASIDPKKIAVAGTSLGGLTSILVTFHRQMRDPRIAAAISIAGPTSMFTTDFFNGSTVPFLDDPRRGGCDRPLRCECHSCGAEVSRQNPGSPCGTRHTPALPTASTLMRFIANPDGVAVAPYWVKDLEDELAAQNGQLMSLLGSAAVASNPMRTIKFAHRPQYRSPCRPRVNTCSPPWRPLPSWRAYLPTTAVYATLPPDTCCETLPAENSSEVSVPWRYKQEVQNPLP